MQKDIYINLTDRGVVKLVTGMKDNKQVIRRNSLQLLIELLYNNETLQMIFCEKYALNPVGNAICLNWFPPRLNDMVALDATLINEIKETKLESKSKYWQWPLNSKYNDSNVPDPNKYLVGFFFANKYSIKYSANAFF